MAVVFTVFVAVPLLLILFVSLHADPGLTRFGVQPYVKFAADAYNRGVLVDTVLLAAETVAITILFGYPIAGLYVAWPRGRRVMMFMVILPLLTSTVVRSFAWVVILGNQGLINRTLTSMGLIDVPLRLLYTPGAVAVALAQIQLPLMVLPLVAALSGIDARLIEASIALGAGAWRTFRRVILPLSLPGLLTGSLLVFTGAASGLITQTMVGGGRLMYMPFYIYEEAIQAQDFPFAAAVAIILLVSIVLISSVLNALGKRSRGFVHA
jgi:putative spermidine/putrescine transport system permease protein